MQVVDYGEAIDKAGGNVDLAKELFGMLLQELPVLRNELQQAISAGDVQACWDHAHKIYGSTAYCGVPQLRQAAAALESDIKAGDLAAISRQFVALDTAINNLLDQGPALLAQPW